MATFPEPNSRLPATGETEASGRLTVFTATRLEAWVARRKLPRGAIIERVGVGLRGWSPPTPEPLAPPRAGCFVSCGLGGGLCESAGPGTVVIPEWVGLPSGDRLPCHPPLVEALVAAAQKLGYAPLIGPLLSTPRLVSGPARRDWSAGGYVAVDMETGPLLSRYPRGAAVRVILDSPGCELSATWERPWRVLLEPWLWPQAARVSLVAPAYALRAAVVVGAALAAMGSCSADR